MTRTRENEPARLRRPALDPARIEPRSTSGYPEPFRSRVVPREKRALGDALGLTKIGVNLTTLFPGKESSMRHFHTHEDGSEVLCTAYSDVDLQYRKGPSGEAIYTRKDGTQY